MEVRVADANEVVQTGDKLRLTFDVLSVMSSVWGWFDPTWKTETYKENVQKGMNEILKKQTTMGYSVLNFKSDPTTNKLTVDLRITDAGKFQGASEGLSIAPLVIVAIVDAIVVIVAVVGVTMSLSKVERILEQPIPALALIALGGIVLYFYLQGEAKKKGATT